MKHEDGHANCRYVYAPSTTQAQERDVAEGAAYHWRVLHMYLASHRSMKVHGL